jgi:hypothetical protein
MAITYTDNDIKELISRACPALSRNNLGAWLETLRSDLDNIVITGGETTTSIKTKLGITTLSGSNTGDQTADTLPDGTNYHLLTTTLQTLLNALTPSIIHVTQTNTFTNNQPIYYSGSAWALARANAVNTMGFGITQNVTSITFDVVLFGKITATSHGLGSAGTWLYVSEGTAGLLTATPPTTYSNPLIFIYDANTLFVFPYLASKIKPDMTMSDLSDVATYTGNGLKVAQLKADLTGIQWVANNATLPDPLGLTTRSTNPTTPAAGVLNIYPKSAGGKDLPYFQNSQGDIFALQAALWESDFFLVTPAATTSMLRLGCEYTAQGTISTAVDSLGTLWSNFAVAATTNSSGGFAAVSAYFTGTKGYRYILKTCFIDADYTTGIRFMAGLSAATMVNISSSDNYAAERAMFSYSVSRGDTNFMFSTRDAGGTESLADTGIAFTATHQYDFYICAPAGGTTIYYKIDDLTAGTSSTVAGVDLSTTLHLPTAATLLYGGFNLVTRADTARNIRSRRIYIKSGN